MTDAVDTHDPAQVLVTPVRRGARIVIPCPDGAMARVALAGLKALADAAPLPALRALLMTARIE